MGNMREQGKRGAIVNADHHVVDPGPSQPTDEPTRQRLSGTMILCGLWVAVIVLAVAVDLAK